MYMPNPYGGGIFLFYGDVNIEIRFISTASRIQESLSG